MRSRLLALGVVVLAAACGAASAQSAAASGAAPTTPADPLDRLPLMVGDHAPDLFVEHWVKGEPITGFEKGRVYLVEFWATWCGPCKKSIPHLTRIQKEFKDAGVTVLGVSIWEGSAKTRPDAAQQREGVRKFVAERGDEMGYAVAFGDSEKTTAAWMKAAGLRGIPAAFLINRLGQVAWIGFPLDGTGEALNPQFEAALRAVADGTHDLHAQAAAHAEAMRPVIEQRKRRGGLDAAIETRDWALADQTVRAAVKSDPAAGREAFQMVYGSLIHAKKDYEAAYALGSAAADGVFRDDAEMLNLIAWIIVDPERPVPTKDLDLALRAAERAVELSSEDAAILDTLATVHVERGDLGKALGLQEKAAKLSKGTRFEEEINARLLRIREKMRKRGG